MCETCLRAAQPARLRLEGRLEFSHTRSQKLAPTDAHLSLGELGLGSVRRVKVGGRAQSRARSLSDGLSGGLEGGNLGSAKLRELRLHRLHPLFRLHEALHVRRQRARVGA